MAKVLAELLEPLDGRQIGTTAEFEQADFDRLEAAGAVKKAVATATKTEPAPRNKRAAPLANKAAKAKN